MEEDISQFLTRGILDRSSGALEQQLTRWKYPVLMSPLVRVPQPLLRYVSLTLPDCEPESGRSAFGQAESRAD
jgi:hypothetical protein